MSKRKLTVHTLALELANERLAHAKAMSEHDEEASFGCLKTIDDFYPKAIEFVLRCRRAVW